MTNNVVSGFDTTQLGRNDDDFSSSISLPFSINFFGGSYNSTYVSNNGYITFSHGQSSFSSSGIGARYSGNPIIAALFADVDTTNAASGITSWGTGTYAGHAAFGATWPGVGYFPNGADKLDTFQILLVDRSDTGTGNFDIYLNYNTIRWANAADAGLNAGIRGNPTGSFTELPGSLTNDAFVDGHTNALTASTNDGTLGQYLYAIRGGTVGGVNLFSIVATDANKPDALTGTTDYRFTVSRLGDVSAAATLDYAITGTGSHPADTALFNSLTASVQFAAGDTSETVDISVDAAAIITNEQFTVTLSNPSTGSILSPTAVGVIGANSTTLPPVVVVPPTPMPTPITPTPPVVAPVAPVAPLPDEDVIRVSPGIIRVMRFFDTQSGSHFFTASATESETTAQDTSQMTTETTSFLALDPATAASDPGAVAVYRFFETQTGGHFFTSSAAERDSIAATRPDMTSEGVAFYEHTTPQAGDTPIYRFFDAQDGSHFYTQDASERASILATRTDLRDEGVAFYAPSGS